MGKLVAGLGVAASALGWFLYSFGTLICVIYAFYLWGGEGLHIGAALWNAFIRWILLMVIATFSLAGGSFVLASLGLNFIDNYIKRKKINHS